MAKAKRTILVADANDFFVEDVRSDPKSEIISPSIAQTNKEVMQSLNDKSLSFVGIFLNPVLPTSFDVGLIRSCHNARPGTPIFLIYDTPPPLSDQELELIGVQSIHPKPLTYTNMVEIVDPPLFDLDKAIESARLDESLDTEINACDTEFKPIRAADFISGKKSFFDVYVQLASGKYIKVLKAGDDFSRDRIENYLKKGIEFFYIRREMQEHFLSYCDKLAASLVKKDSFNEKTKVKLVLIHGQETLDFLKNQGVSETNLYHATRFLGHITNLVDDFQLRQTNIIKEFMANLLLYDHGNACAMIASLLMKPLNFSDKTIRETIGLACMFHDIGLIGSAITIQEEDESKMDDEQLAIFHQHPIKGAEILGEIAGIDPAVVQAVEQHHERRNRQGFPKQLGAGSINLISEIVGVSDEFVRLIKLAKSDSTVSPAKEMELRIFNGFSFKVVDAFQVGVLGKKPSI